MTDRIAEYHHKMLILRQIMSNKAEKYGRVNMTANISTVLVSSVLTFMGFSGIERITTYVGWVMPVERGKVELAFNLLVLLLFILVILHLVFRFAEKQAAAERAIVSLTHLINEADDYIDRAERGYVVDTRATDLVREKYDTIIQVLPANTDREFIAAKQDFAEKRTRAAVLRLTAQDVFDAGQQGRVVEALIERSELLPSILEALRTTDARLYLGGGLVRNAVWDFLHGYQRPTPIEDVDVVYFDPDVNTKAQDVVIEARLQQIIPNVRWSVKNQARMHTVNGDQPYTSLEDAIEKWPETATAIAVRRLPNGEVEVVAPYGFGDLFRLVVAPTPHFVTQRDRFMERVNRKKWSAMWPKLQVRHS